MNASYAALQTTSHNIANASVEGYSRQRVEVETSRSQYSGSGYFGLGVEVSTVTRAHDDFLTKEASTASSLAAMDATHADQLNRLEPIFSTGESGLGYTAMQFLNAMVDVAARPQDLAAREVVLSRARDVASRFSSAGTQLDALQRGVTQDLQNSVGTVNGLAQRLAQVNAQVAAAVGSGHTPNDLLDERDRLIKQMSQFLQVSTMASPDGTVGVFIAGGQKLVLGSEAGELTVIPDPSDSTRSALAMKDGPTSRVLPPSLLAGGSISGLLKFQSDDLVQAGNYLGQMARALSDRVNQQQALGVDLVGNAGQPIFEVGAPRVLPSPTNNPASTAPQLEVVDASKVQASDYELQVDPNQAGHYLLTRLRDQQQWSIASGDVVDGVKISLTGTPPSGSDRYTLQPVGRAAIGMQVTLTRPEGIAAALPVSAALGANNTGTAAIASLTMVRPPSTPIPTITFTFGTPAASPTNAINYTVNDGVNPPVSGVWTPGQPLDAGDFSLTLSGVPKEGDTVEVSRTRFTTANNGNALVMANLREERFIDGANITESYAGAMGNIGVRVQAANTASTISAGVASAADNRRSAQAGVNLDEEAANLIHQQQSYQAAAKVLQTAQSVFDTLLQIAGR